MEIIEHIREAYESHEPTKCNSAEDMLRERNSLQSEFVVSKEISNSLKERYKYYESRVEDLQKALEDDAKRIIKAFGLIPIREVAKKHGVVYVNFGTREYKPLLIELVGCEQLFITEQELKKWEDSPIVNKPKTVYPKSLVNTEIALFQAMKREQC